MAAFNLTGLVVGVSLTVLADAGRTNQTVIVRPVLPSAIAFPHELRVAPSLGKPEPHLGNFSESSEVHRSYPGKSIAESHSGPIDE